MTTRCSPVGTIKLPAHGNVGTDVGTRKSGPHGLEQRFVDRRPAIDTIDGSAAIQDVIVAQSGNGVIGENPTRVAVGGRSGHHVAILTANAKRCNSKVMSDPVMTTENLTFAAMEARVVRYADLKPCYNAFIDTRTPGSEAKENFTIIGPGVSENPAQHVHIAEPHGFNIGGARQPPACVNSQHSHDTAEVFVVHSGTWRFDLGEHGTDAQVAIGPGDVISLPTGMFRGFTNIGQDSGFLFAVLGGDDPGSVLWAPRVFDMAADYGLVLLENGQLIDTAAGQALPDGARPMPRTSAEQVAALRIPTATDAEAIVWRARHASGADRIIASDGTLDWDHPFTLDRVVATSDDTDVATPMAAEVLFVQSGSLLVSWASGSLSLAPGDTMTMPIGHERRLSGDAIYYRVSGHC